MPLILDIAGFLTHMHSHSCFYDPSPPSTPSTPPTTPHPVHRQVGGAIPPKPCTSPHPICLQWAEQLEAPTTNHFQTYKDKDREHELMQLNIRGGR